jgi:hypothetical protein
MPIPWFRLPALSKVHPEQPFSAQRTAATLPPKPEYQYKFILLDEKIPPKNTNVFISNGIPGEHGLA